MSPITPEDVAELEVPDRVKECFKADFPLATEMLESTIGEAYKTTVLAFYYAYKKGYEAGYEDASEDAPDCDNCDERMGEPQINEGYI